MLRFSLKNRWITKTFSVVFLTWILLIISAIDIAYVNDINSNIDLFIIDQKQKLQVASNAKDLTTLNNNVALALYLEKSYDDAIFYYSSALEAAGNKCSAERSLAKGNLVYLNSLKTNITSGHSDIKLAIFCARELKDKRLESELRLIQGKLFVNQGNYSEGFGSFFKANEIKELIYDEPGLIECNINFASALTELGQVAQAKSYLQKALALSKKHKNPHQKSRIYSLLSQNFVAENKINYAKAYATKALEQATESNSKFGRANAYLCFADLFIAVNDFEKGNDYIFKASKELNGSQRTVLREDINFRRAKLSLGLNRAQEAIVVSSSALRSDLPFTSVNHKSRAYQTQVKAYNGLNDYKKAFDLSNEHNELKSQLGITGAYQQFLQLRKKSEQVVNQTTNIKQQAENELQYQEQKTSNAIRYSLLFVFAMLLALAVILFRQVRIKQKNNAELEQRNKLINRQNVELRKMNSVLDEARQQAEAGSVAKSNFLAVTSHEIRTPMNGIMGMASLLLESPLNGEQKKYVETIQASSENLLTILNDILDFSKIEAGKMNIESTLIDLERLLDEVLIIFSKQAKDKNIKLKKFIGNAMIKQFRGDILRIRQVLINLVSNAIKFTENGEVKIMVEIDELLRASSENARIAKLRFSVKDDGIGISEEKQRKIFESFEQEDSSTSRKYGGIGLGLSISKKLVELMGGEIGLTSKKNVGTSFYFTLNVEIPKQLSVEEKPVNLNEDGKVTPLIEGKISESHPLKILVAEDNPFNKLFIDKLFEKFGYTDALHAENGIEVLKQLDKNEVDLILMDIQMPEMDGLKATQRIIEKYGENRPILIALTADANESSKGEFLSAGMDGFLSKPFKADDLKEILINHSNLLRNKELAG